MSLSTASRSATGVAGSVCLGTADFWHCASVRLDACQLRRLIQDYMSIETLGERKALLLRRPPRSCDKRTVRGCSIPSRRAAYHLHSCFETLWDPTRRRRSSIRRLQCSEHVMKFTSRTCCGLGPCRSIDHPLSGATQTSIGARFPMLL